MGGIGEKRIGDETHPQRIANRAGETAVQEMAGDTLKVHTRRIRIAWIALHAIGIDLCITPFECSTTRNKLLSRNKPSSAQCKPTSGAFFLQRRTAAENGTRHLASVTSPRCSRENGHPLCEM
jgi:hypothetical protein